MCGIPSSGKTTLARAIKDELDSEMSVEIVSTDRWRDEEFYSDFKPENERRVRETALRETRELIAGGISVIHDDTNYYTSMRHELYEIATEMSCVFAVVHISTSVETALMWNSDRRYPIPEPVVMRINEKFDLPGSKYAWDRAIATVNMALQQINNTANDIVERLAVLSPIKPNSDESAEQTSSDNLLDVVTRQIVNRFLREYPEYRGNKRISRIRRDIIAEAKREGYSIYDVDQKLMKKLMNLNTRTS